MELAQLAVFVRPPLVGEVKTRLAHRLGERGAAALYEAFVEDTVELCRRVRAAGRIDIAMWSVAPVDSTVCKWARELGSTPRLQPEGDLGVRLSAAFEEGFREFERVVIIGSDSPTLPLDLVVAAFDALDDAPIALGPSNDGGYYAVGATRTVRPSFGGVRWSTRTALQDTIYANPEHPVAILSPWYDVDEPEDLEILTAHLSADAAAAPVTARCLERLRWAHR